LEPIMRLFEEAAVCVERYGAGELSGEAAERAIYALLEENAALLPPFFDFVSPAERITWPSTPEKIAAPDDSYMSPPLQRLFALTRDAQREFLVLSPYFVPHDAGVNALGRLTARGVRVAILTNSLAATDAIAVQAGYAPYRVPMLERGVELYEYKPDPG
ncbi:phospholipase D-like domain-containing protein, partial [Ralstonia sp. VS2407]